MNRSALHALAIALIKIVLSEILVRGLAREQMVADREDRVADGQDGEFAAPPGCQPTKVGGEVLVQELSGGDKQLL